MSKEIEEFIEYLKQEVKKTQIYYHLPYIERLRNFNKNFKVKLYDVEKYDCEMAALWSRNKEVIDIFKNDNFEIKHPFLNHITNRIVKTVQFDNQSFFFFIDKDNRYPWIACNLYSLGDYIVTKDGFYSANKAIFNANNNNECSIWFKYFLVDTLPKMLTFNIDEYKFKEAKFKINLHGIRPWHTYKDILAWFYALDIKNKDCYNKAFFLPNKDKYKLNYVNTNFDDDIFIEPRLGHFDYDLDIQLNMEQQVHSEAIECDTLLIDNQIYDVIIWLGIPGERRTWLTQLEGIPSILKKIARYFPKIKVYVDGMTAYDGERIEVADNLKAFKAIKAEVDKLNLDIDMESLNGYDYRSKICYCSTCDIAISDVSTTALTPFNICKKPGVAFYQEIENHLNYALSLQKNIKFLFVLDKNALLTTNIRNSLSKDFHIPWQHLYNLAAQSLEEIKGIKMHRLDVPPVELVAKQYDLEKELSIKIPMESVALYDKITKQINTLANNQEMMMDKINIIISNEINLKYNNALKENENLKAQLSKLLNQEYKSLTNQITNQTAKSRIKNQLTYKLGEAMIANSKSLLGYIRMPYILSYIKETHQKNQKLYQEKIKANPSLKLPPLESYPDYNEAIKIKEHLSYKLGEALIKADKSKLGYLTLWFKCKKITKEHKDNHKNIPNNPNH